jgi:hypothetical protein
MISLQAFNEDEVRLRVQNLTDEKLIEYGKAGKWNCPYLTAMMGTARPGIIWRFSCGYAGKNGADGTRAPLIWLSLTIYTSLRVSTRNMTNVLLVKCPGRFWSRMTIPPLERCSARCSSVRTVQSLCGSGEREAGYRTRS